MRTFIGRQGGTVLLLAGLLFSGGFMKLTIQQGKGGDFLKYDVSDVFVGSINHTISLYNPAYSVAKGTLVVPLIHNETARHYVTVINFSSTMGQPKLVTDGSENLYASWNDMEISGEGNATFETDYLVLSLATQYQIDTNYSADYDKNSKLYTEYTRPEDLIESDDPKIIQEAQNVTGNANTTSAKAYRIYDFVVRHIRYVAQYEERGALWALENGTGDCSEYSYLFVALCRASGIPARIKAGFAFHYTDETTEDGHMWAEYYLGEYGWVPVDATWELFNTMDCTHFCSIQGTPGDMPYANYVFNSAPGIIVEDRQTVTLQPESTRVFGDNSLAQNLTDAVQNRGQAEFALFLEEILGSPWIFPSEAEKAQQSILKCSLLLQQALEQSNLTSLSNCIEEAQETTQKAWTTIAITVALYIGFAAVIAVAAFTILMRQHVTKRAKTI